MSPNLYLMVVPLIRRNAQPIFNRRSYCNTFTLHPRMAAYTCSSTHAHGTAGTCVRSTGRGTVLISPPPRQPRRPARAPWPPPLFANAASLASNSRHRRHRRNSCNRCPLCHTSQLHHSPIGAVTLCLTCCTRPCHSHAIDSPCLRSLCYSCYLQRVWGGISSLPS